jgi:hypothetical protein
MGIFRRLSAFLAFSMRIPVCTTFYIANKKPAGKPAGFEI